jgi:hypothetical protein
LRATANGELNIPRQIFLLEPGQEAAHVLFDPSPRSYQRYDRRVILGIQPLARSSPPQRSRPRRSGRGQGIPDRSVAPSDGLRSVRASVGHNANQSLIGPVVMSYAAEIADAHLRSPIGGHPPQTGGGVQLRSPFVRNSAIRALTSRLTRAAGGAS